MEDDLTIQAIMRHSNVNVTERCYIKTAGSETRAATQKMEEPLTDTCVTPQQPAPINPAVQ